MLRYLIADTPAHIRFLSPNELRQAELTKLQDQWVFVFKAGALSKEALFQALRA